MQANKKLELKPNSAEVSIKTGSEAAEGDLHSFREMELIVLSTKQKVIARLIKELEATANSTLMKEDIFRIGVSGGSVLDILEEAIPRVRTDLRKWQFFFVDERYVESSSEHSIFGEYKRRVMPLTNIREHQFVRVNTRMSIEECAKDYEAQIAAQFRVEFGCVPEFDALILGVGPDGHVASLFPGHPALVVQDRLIVPIEDSPKPPPKRVTMTLPLINHAKCVIVTMCGESKAEIAKRLYFDEERLPANMVHPQHNNLICILDEAAGKDLNIPLR